MESTIKETKEMVTFACAFGNGLGKSFEDNEITWSDAANLIDVLKEAPAAFIGVTEIPSELKEFTAEEQEELKAHIAVKFDIPQDEIEGYVERGLGLAIALAAFIAGFFKKKEA